MHPNTLKVYIVTEVRIYKIRQHFYAEHSFAKIIERYSKNFGKIILATRVINGEEKKSDFIQIDDYCETIDSIGSIPLFLLKRTPKSIKNHIEESDLVVLRVHSLIAPKIYRQIRLHSKKYMTEVMGCAWDAYWNHGPIGKIIAPTIFFKTKRIIDNADYCVYVTRDFLQNRYPCSGKSIGISNVDISSVNKQKSYKSFNKKSFTMMTAAAIDVKYKGQQYIIRAISLLKKKYGINVQYYLAGKGDSSRLTKIAKRHGVEKNVIFLGMLTKDELSKRMRKTDIYVQPSLQEGLPRSLIEAMSQGCVCIGSKIAGIPELLKKEQLFKRKKIKSIVQTILFTCNQDLSIISKDNLSTASQYLNQKLSLERNEFYKIISSELNHD